jgi:hypothetical protein
LAIKAAQQSTGSAKAHQSSHYPNTKTQAALPGAAGRWFPLFRAKASKVCKAQGQYRQTARSKAGEQTSAKYQAESARPWLLQRIAQQLFAAAGEITDS